MIARSAARVEPHHAMVTALILDVRGFTAFAHRTTAREAMAFVDELFGLALPVVEAHGGHTHRLLGDGALVLFGLPEPLPDHADRALEAAAELSATVERELGDRCRIGIGVNSGLVLAGTIVAGATQELTVIGDPVNVTARVEQATRDLDEPVLVTEATRCLLERAAGRLRPCGTIAAKGKPAPIAVYGLRTPAAVTMPGRPARTTGSACPPS
jgi:adenylate cyclase